MSTSRAARDRDAAVPKRLGYIMPPEWAAHDATWLSWPHNIETWPGAFETVEPAYTRIVEALAGSEIVLINVLDADHEEHVRQHIGDLARRVRFNHIPTNDAWARDHGPTFVQRSDPDGIVSIAAIDWVYNGWGGKYPPYDLDAAAAGKMARGLGVQVFETELCIEGGAIESNGAGVVMTTESCALHPNRNPNMTQSEVAATLRAYTGADRLIWLPGGDIAGDDTDGHIDNIARFVREDVVVIPTEQDPLDPNYETLRENRQAIASAQIRGRPPTVVELPTPHPIFVDDRRLPASYANFYIANTVVLVPTYRCSQDLLALEILQTLFPRRKVVGLDCVDIIWGLGAIHCLTQQVPARSGVGQLESPVPGRE